MILLTRPYEQSAALASILGEKNCVIAPMMEIVKCEFTVPKNVQATISTSKNVDYDADIKIPEQGKTADEILQYCLARLSPTDGKVIYLSGDDVTLDIAAKLREHKFDTERIVAYGQVPTDKMDTNFDEISIATFFSLNSIKNFEKLADEQDLSDISCVCISKKVNDLANQMGWKKTYVADAPNLSGMLDKIQQAFLDS